MSTEFDSFFCYVPSVDQQGGTALCSHARGVVSVISAWSSQHLSGGKGAWWIRHTLQVSTQRWYRAHLGSLLARASHMVTPNFRRTRKCIPLRCLEGRLTRSIWWASLMTNTANLFRVCVWFFPVWIFVEFLYFSNVKFYRL